MSTLTLLLRDKLEAVTKQQMEFIKSTQVLNKCLVKVNKMVDDFATSETRSSMTALKIGLFLESLEENLSICQDIFKSLEDYNTDSVDFIPMVDSNNLYKAKKAATVQENTAIALLQSQLEQLQVEVCNLQEANKKEMDKIEKMETEILLTKESNQSDTSNLNVRLQNVEVKQLLIDKIHVKNSEIINRNNTEMSKLRIDIISLQDQLERANALQADTQTQTKKMKAELDTLTMLRDILSQKNKNVESRTELTETVSHLKEEMEKIQLQMSCLEINSVDSEDKDNDVMPAFSANVSSSFFIFPGNKLRFLDVSLNKWGCYSQSDGAFEAPVSGIYVFFASVNADSPGGLCIAIVHNGNSAALSSTCGTKNSQTSTSALLELDAGDKVWIETDKQTDSKGIKIGSGFSNFIGFRVQ